MFLEKVVLRACTDSPPLPFFIVIFVPEASLLWTTEKLLQKLQPCGKYLPLLSYAKRSPNSLWKEQVVFLGIGCQRDAVVRVTSVSVIWERNAISPKFPWQPTCGPHRFALRFQCVRPVHSRHGAESFPQKLGRRNLQIPNDKACRKILAELILRQTRTIREIRFGLLFLCVSVAVLKRIQKLTQNIWILRYGKKGYYCFGEQVYLNEFWTTVLWKGGN